MADHEDEFSLKSRQCQQRGDEGKSDAAFIDDSARTLYRPAVKGEEKANLLSDYEDLSAISMKGLCGGKEALIPIYASFLERYQNGEHEHVWADLVALGSGVRDNLYLADAQAVANETMRRAGCNVETLIVRLHGLGYEFRTKEKDACQRA